MWVYCGETNLFFFIPLVLLLFFAHTIAECLSPHKTIRCSVYTYPMTLHFINRRAAASLRHRNRATATVLVCEQKPYPVLTSGMMFVTVQTLFTISYPDLPREREISLFSIRLSEIWVRHWGEHLLNHSPTAAQCLSYLSGRITSTVF